MELERGEIGLECGKMWGVKNRAIFFGGFGEAGIEGFLLRRRFWRESFPPNFRATLIRNRSEG